MKNSYRNFIIFIFLSILGTCYSYAYEYAENRRVEPFHNLSINTIGDIHFVQSSDYALRIEGTRELVKKHQTKVVNNTLSITIESKEKESNTKRIKGVDIYIYGPNLRKLALFGIGSFFCEDPLILQNADFNLDGVGDIEIKDLRCDKLDIDINGVGEGNINVRCNYLEADLNGIGSITLSGYAKQSRINKNGVGSVNTKNLKTNK